MYRLLNISRLYGMVFNKKRLLPDHSVRRRNIFSPRYHFSCRILPASHSRRPPALPSVCTEVSRGLTGFLITVEFRSELLFRCSGHTVCISALFRPDCSQGIASAVMLFPRTCRQLSENMNFREVVSCSSHWLFS